MERFCAKCGNKVQDEAQFCTFCGEPAQPPTQPPPPYAPTPAPSKKRSNPVLLVIIIAAAVLVVALVAVLIGTKVFGLISDKPASVENPTTVEKPVTVENPAAEEVVAPAPAAPDTDDPILGTWRVESFLRDGEMITWEEYEEYLISLGATDTTDEMTFLEGGLISSNFMGTITMDTTWLKVNDGKYVIFDNYNDPLEVELVDGKLILTQKNYDTYLILVRT